MNDKNQNQDNVACLGKRYEITQDDLPLSCPPRDCRVWDAHPRIYLPIEVLGKVFCPYCNAEYVLKDFVPSHDELT